MRILLGSLYCFIFTFLIYKIEQDFVTRDIFKIKEISFYGDSNLVKEELKKLGNALYDKNIFNLNVDSIEKKLQTDIRIEKVKISSKNIGGIDINIKEKEAQYYANIKDKLYSVDSSGQIFAQMEEHGIKKLPIVFIQNEKELLKVVKILENVEDDELYDMISQVYYKNELYIELFIDSGTILKTNGEIPNFK
ncbi:MAG: cell division protein FtsQ/DivIB, partial [Fusobacteriaceae bacterium]